MATGKASLPAGETGPPVLAVQTSPSRNRDHRQQAYDRLRLCSKALYAGGVYRKPRSGHFATSCATCTYSDVDAPHPPLDVLGDERNVDSMVVNGMDSRRFRSPDALDPHLRRAPVDQSARYWQSNRRAGAGQTRSTRRTAPV